MATLDSLQFEMERRVILFNPNTSMPDDSQLGFNANPNTASSTADPLSGEFLIYNSPNSTRYAEFDASNNVKQEWYKVAQPNSWSKMGTGSDSSSGFPVVYNVGSGDASIYYGNQGHDASILLRTIKGGTNIKVSTSDNIIVIDSSSSATYDTTLSTSLTMPNAVGGYPAGTSVTSLKGGSLIEMWDNLLFPTVNPTYVAPFNTYTITPNAELQIIGDTLNVVSAAGLNKGQILVAGDFQNYRSGDPSTYFYTDPSGNTLLVQVDTSSITNSQTINGYKVTLGYQNFTNQISYKTGPQPLTNKGAVIDSPLPASSTGLITRRYEGVYPIFAKTSNITTYTQQPLYSMITGQNIVLALVAESGGNKQSFDLPDAFRTLVGIEQLNTVSNNYEPIDINTWLPVTSTTHTINGEVISYDRYTYNGAQRSNVSIRLKF